jgi:hypothetical protein
MSDDDYDQERGYIALDRKTGGLHNWAAFQEGLSPMSDDDYDQERGYIALDRKTGGLERIWKKSAVA